MRRALQTIKSVSGRPEYVLLPIAIYKVLKNDINDVLDEAAVDSEYVDFNPGDFITNPIALLRMKAKIKQTELARRLNVTQAYISKIERDDYKVSRDLLERVKRVCG